MGLAMVGTATATPAGARSRGRLYPSNRRRVAYAAVLRRLGVNLLYLVPRQVGGTEIYARRLVAALARRAPGGRAGGVLRGRGGRGAPGSRSGRATCASCALRSAPRASRCGWRRSSRWLPAAADHHGVELLHSLGTTAPLHGRAVRVTTVHDLIYEHFPGAFPPAARLGLKLVVPAGARRSRRVQVSSSYTKADVVEHFGLAPEQGRRRAARARDARRARARRRRPSCARAWSSASDPVLLSVNAALPHKNLERLLRARSRSCPSRCSRSSGMRAATRSGCGRWRPSWGSPSGCG